MKKIIRSILIINWIFVFFIYKITIANGVSSNLDSSRINAINKVITKILEEKLDQNKYDTLKFFLGLSLNNAVQKQYQKGIAESSFLIGKIFRLENNNDSALKHFATALLVAEKSNQKELTAKASHEIGLSFQNNSNYSNALFFYLKALKYREEINDFLGQSRTLTNIGIVYYFQQNYDLALKFWNKSLQIKEVIDDRKGIAYLLNNIAILYKVRGDNYSLTKDYSEQIQFAQYDTALFFHNKALQIKEKLEDKKGIVNSLMNIGNVYVELKKYEESEKYYNRALGIAIAINSQDQIANIYSNLGMVNRTRKQYDKATQFYLKSLDYFIKERNLFLQRNCYQDLILLQLNKSNSKQLLDFFIKYQSLSDSLYSDKNSKNISEMQTRYETDKKQNQIALLTKDKALKESEIKKQTIIRNFFIGFFLLVALLAFVIFRSYKQKKKANELLEKQKMQIGEQRDSLQELNMELNQQKEEILAQRDEIENQNNILLQANKIIENKNKNITDSIRYALRIQQTILPHIKKTKEIFPQSFILHKPKAIVSGDFYWFSTHTITQKHKKILFSVIDCTGHGVPGAFMSLIGYNLLKKAVFEQQLIQPSLVLNSMTENLLLDFHNLDSESTAKDGMDLALCALDMKDYTLEFSASHNPIYIIREQNVIELKPDKHSIGNSFTENFKTFTNHKIQLINNDVLYLFSDGYIDQFSEKDNKRISSKTFKEILIHIQSLEMEEQKVFLEKFFMEWKGKTDQIDDVLIWGIKINY